MAQKINLEQTLIDELSAASEIGINTTPLTNISGDNLYDAMASVDTGLASAGAEVDPTVDITENVSANDVICKLPTDIDIAIADKRYGSKIEVIGFSTQTKTAGDAQTLSLKRSGIMGGFTGLITGSPVFLSNNGGVTQDPFTIISDEYRVYLGVAFSPTEIVVSIGEAMRMGAGMEASLSGVGMASYFAGENIPYGWLYEDGRSLLKADFSELFSIIGTTYGSVDSLHFNIPESRDKFLRGGRIPQIFTADDTLNQITISNHGITRDGTPVWFSGDDLPDPLVAGTVYYVSVIDVNTLFIYTTENDAIIATTNIDLTDTGTGTHTIHFTGMEMEAAMWAHHHNFNRSTQNNTVGGGGGSTYADSSDSIIQVLEAIDDGVNGTPNLRNESRPEHNVMVRCIRYLPFPVAINKLDAAPVWEVGQPYAEKPVDSTLWEFSSPSLANSLGENPVVEGASVYWNPSGDANNKWNNRGTVYTGDTHEGGLVYDYSFGNTGYVKFRFKPNFTYDVAGIRNIITIRSAAGTGFQGIFFIYNPTTDQLMLDLYTTDAGNKIAITTDAFTDNPSLQQWHDVVITWDGPGDDADFYLNGVQQGGGAEGTKTPTGTLTGLNITATKLVLCNGFDDLILDNNATTSTYITDMLVGDIWNDNTINYDGSANTLPTANRNRAMGNETNHSIDKYGNISGRSGHFDDLFMNGARVVESGSNSNGSYVKFADGTMMCYYTDTVVLNTSIAAGNVFKCADTAFTFPTSFTTTPVITITSRDNSTPNTWPGYISVPSATGFTACIYGTTAPQSGVILYQAIGKWRD